MKCILSQLLFVNWLREDRHGNISKVEYDYIKILD